MKTTDAPVAAPVPARRSLSQLAAAGPSKALKHILPVVARDRVEVAAFSSCL